MKKILIAGIVTALSLPFSATAQDTVSTVVGKKLNFEAPLFGVSLKKEKPVWTVTAFGEISGGVSYRFGTPSQMKPVGYFADLSLLELRYRPRRDGHLFTWGISTAAQGNSLKKGWSWDEKGGIAATPANWLKAKAAQVEVRINFPVGYVYEWGDWKTGFWIVPGYGHTSLRNIYSLGVPVSLDGPGYGAASPGSPVVYVEADDGNRHVEQLNGNFGFRLGLKAGLGWRNVGFSVGYDFSKSVGPGHFAPRFDTVSAGIMVRH